MRCKLIGVLSIFSLYASNRFFFVSVVFIVVVVVFLRSRRNKRENPTMPEEGNGEKKISFFFHLMKFMNAHASS